MVGEVEAVGDFDGEPCCVWSISAEFLSRSGAVRRVGVWFLFVYVQKSRWAASVFSVDAWLDL